MFDVSSSLIIMFSFDRKTSSRIHSLLNVHQQTQWVQYSSFPVAGSPGSRHFPCPVQRPGHRLVPSHAPHTRSGAHWQTLTLPDHRHSPLPDDHNLWSPDWQAHRHGLRSPLARHAGRDASVTWWSQDFHRPVATVPQ